MGGVEESLLFEFFMRIGLEWSGVERREEGRSGVGIVVF